MTDPTPSVAETVGATPHASTRLAAHLADVKNEDAAHRIVRNGVDQKVDALSRMVCEMYAKMVGLAERLPGDLCKQIQAATAEAMTPYAGNPIPNSAIVEAQLGALLRVVAPDDEENA